jgi:tetratricopeptide (TPR) repeat protein
MSETEVEKLCHQGRLFIKGNDLPAAVAIYSKAVGLDPDSCDAHEGLATCAYLGADYQEAIKQYIRLTLLKPMESRFYTNLGAIHNRIGDHMKACDYLRKAIQRNKRCAESFYNLGIAQRKLKQNVMAVSAYKEAIKIDPMMAEAYQNLANVYVDMGNLQMAVANFKKALEIKPDFEKARVGLEKADEQLNQAKKQNNPFGRLAAIQSTVTAVAPVSSRELNAEERFEDRKFIKHAAEEIERLAKGCVDHLRLKLVPAILEVERAMAHGAAEEIFLLDEAATAFREATSHWDALRRTLKKRVEELRVHEEEINATG